MTARAHADARIGQQDPFLFVFVVHEAGQCATFDPASLQRLKFERSAQRSKKPCAVLAELMTALCSADSEAQFSCDASYPEACELLSDRCKLLMAPHCKVVDQYADNECSALDVQNCGSNPSCTSSLRCTGREPGANQFCKALGANCWQHDDTCTMENYCAFCVAPPHWACARFSQSATFPGSLQ